MPEIKEEKIPVKFSYAGKKYDIVGSKFKPSGLNYHIVRFHFETPHRKDGQVIVLYTKNNGEYHWLYPSEPTEDNIAGIISRALINQEGIKV